MKEIINKSIQAAMLLLVLVFILTACKSSAKSGCPNLSKADKPSNKELVKKWNKKIR